MPWHPTEALSIATWVSIAAAQFKLEQLTTEAPTGRAKVAKSAETVMDEAEAIAELESRVAELTDMQLM